MPECRSRMRQRLRAETAWEDVVGLHCAMRAASVQGNAVAAYDELEKASAPFSKVCLVLLLFGTRCECELLFLIWHLAKARAHC